MKRSVDRPIFFVGMPRSGTTMVFEALAAHRSLAWLSNYSNRIPWLPEVTLIHRVFGRRLGRKDQDGTMSALGRIFPEPSETYAVWERFFGREFSYSFLLERRPTGTEAQRCRDYMSRLIAAQGRDRLSVKFTGPPRAAFLRVAFPDAVFVNIVREPRAVVASLLSVDFWRERGLHQPFWDGGLTKDDLANVSDRSNTPVALAALQYRAVARATEMEFAGRESSVITVEYERFIQEPHAEMERILSHASLPASSDVSAHLRSHRYRNMNYKYKDVLSAEDIKLVDRLCSR